MTNNSKLHVGWPNVGNREALLVRINAMLDRRWFSNSGPLVQEFEKRVAEFLGVKIDVISANEINRAYPEQPSYGKLRPRIGWNFEKLASPSAGLLQA